MTSNETPASEAARQVRHIALCARMEFGNSLNLGDHPEHMRNIRARAEEWVAAESAAVRAETLEMVRRHITNLRYMDDYGDDYLDPDDLLVAIAGDSA